MFHPQGHHAEHEGAAKEGQNGPSLLASGLLGRLYGQIPGFIPSLVAVLAVVLVLGLMSIDPPLMSMLVMLAYAGSGVVLTLNQLRRSRSERRNARAAQRDAA
jgi:hypothetical protein